ncbi:MAG TPA: hypothetical protein H9839_07565 [Candidatus Intestinimonas stercorigallinarum]|nr:hypothetical protein [Candidatus Intestinimonas stercorigallinarum]
MIGVNVLRAGEHEGLKLRKALKAAVQQRGRLNFGSHEKEAVREDRTSGGQVVLAENGLQALHMVAAVSQFLNLAQLPVDRGAHIPYAGHAFGFVAHLNFQQKGELWNP